MLGKGRPQAFAAATAKPGKGPHRLIASGAPGQEVQVGAGAKSKLAMTQRKGRPCKPNGQGNGACQF